MDNDGACDDNDLAALFFYAAHFPGDGIDREFDTAFARDAGGHELEFVPALGGGLRVDANAIDAADDAIADAEVAHQRAGCGGVVYDDDGVHALLRCAKPFAFDAYVGGVDRRAV